MPQQNISLNTLNDIRSQFLVTPVDKANGNTVFIFQQLELGLDENTTDSNKINIPGHRTNYQVIFGFLRNKFNLVVNEENKKLPNIY